MSIKIHELPNAISLLEKQFHGQAWIEILHHYDSLFFSTVVALIISLIFYWGSRHHELIPTGLQNALEWFVEGFRNVIEMIIGPEGEKYVPFLGTLFVYILSMNLLGLIPIMKSPTSNINVTAGLAICVFCLVQYLNIRNRGFFGFLYHLAGSPKDLLGWILVPLMFPMELITQLARPLTLSMRLFGNIFGGDIFIAIFVLFGIGALSFLNLPIGLPLQLPFMVLAILAGVIQAMVFTLLSSVYILLSIPSHGDEH